MTHGTLARAEVVSMVGNMESKIHQASAQGGRTCTTGTRISGGRFSWRMALAVIVTVSAQSVSRAVAADPAHVARAKNGMVATVHPLATDAAVQILKTGGNAIDAAVTAGLVLGVVDGANSGLGGGCFIMIRQADGQVWAIDGREMAPAAAHAEMFLVNGKADSRLSQTGALAAGVPGALAAYALAVEKFGNKPLAELLELGRKLADEGFILTAADSAKLRRAADEFRRFEGSRAVFLDDNDEPWPAGHRFRQLDLAATYQGIATQGTDYFYKGPVAKLTETWMQENGGIITAADFANYVAPFREPVRSSYRGHGIIGFPPSSSGGVHVAQILNILKHFDLAAMEHASRIHVIAEAMKLAFADRAHWLGDADFAKVPKGLANADYAKELAARIQLDRASAVASHGMPPEWESNLFNRHTTHFSVADAAGNWVAITATINTSFGSKVVIPGTGIALNNEMDDFSIQPGVPNAFGLIGGEANKIEPGKRPLSAMSPTFVTKGDGEVLLAVGAAGGPTIISQTVLVITGMIDFEMDLGAALAQPRFHHQWIPASLRIEEAIPAAVRDELTRRGHQLQVVKQIGVSQAVGRDGAEFVGGHDPRVAGKAGGW
jgi:gamma-glutamyltranspeptidase/glutathione hydrolase